MTYIYNREEYSDLVKAMKSADTTAENKATPWAQATLKALFYAKTEDGLQAFTTDSMTAALCAIYKPKTASGKAAKTVGSLPASPRQRANCILYIEKNKGIAGVMEAVDAFIAGNKSTLASLMTTVKAAVKDNAVPDDSDSDSDSDSQPMPVGDSDSRTATASDVLGQMKAFVEKLTIAEIHDNSAALAALYDAINDAWEMAHVEVAEKLAA